MAQKYTDPIKTAAGEHAKEELKARKQYLNLRLQQDPEVRRLVTGTADRVAASLSKNGGTKLSKKQLRDIEAAVDRETEQFRNDFTEKITGYVRDAAEIGASPAKAITVKLFQNATIPKVTVDGLNQMFVRTNQRAVQAVWDRTEKGLKLSDRIWNTSGHARDVMKQIIREGVASGQSAIDMAKMLQQYVNKGALTLAKNYPEIRDRIKGIPKDLSYEALRLARTETTKALGEGQIKSAQASPGCRGIKYCLSPAHRIVDICDELARADEAGLGLGVYPVDDPPPYPAHPNTMSFLVPVNEKPEDFTKRLKEWTKNPSSDQKLETWYNNTYKDEAATPDKSGLTPELKKLYINIKDLPKAAKVGLAQSWTDARLFGITNNREILFTRSAKTGEQIHALAGTQGSVSFTSSLIDYLSNAPKNSLVMIHNHPSSSSFSGTDLITFSKYPSIHYMTVVGHNGTRYTMKIGKGLKMKPEEVDREWNKIYDKNYDYYDEQVRTSKMTSREALVEHIHQTNSEFANMFKWEYKVYPVEGD